MINIVKQGDKPRRALDTLEQKIDSLKKETVQVQDAYVPLDEVREKIRSRIEYLLYQKTPENGFQCFQNVDRKYAALPEVFGFEHFVFLLGTETVLDLIMARLESNGRQIGLPAVERAARVEELQAQVRNAEREAELEVLRLEAAGYTVLRRPDTDVHVLLEVWAGMPANTPQSAPATSRN